MNDIDVITDSTCDIPQPMIDKYKIKVVPHHVIWGEKQYIDRVDLQPQEFYEKLKIENSIPTSAQATVQDFLDKYQESILQGAKEIIVVTISSAMSGAFHMAEEAARLVKIPVHVVDAKGPSMTEGWQVLEAARGRDKGETVNCILENTDHVRQKLVQIVGMNSLSFLQQGGRIGDAAKWIGSKLQIKPVISINHETGRVEPAGIATTYSGLMDMVYKKFIEKVGTGERLHVAVMHGNALDEAKQLAERISEHFKDLELIINITGPVLGINTGPRALAICGYFE
jgi:DegV family protein with EDD domain